MNNIQSYLTAAITILAANSITAADNLDVLVKQILANNKAVETTRLSNMSELESMKSENNLSDPEIGFEHQWGRKHIGNKWSFSIAQSFDWPGIYGARKEAIRQSESAMGYLQAQIELDKMVEIKRTLIDIINVKSNVALMEELFGYYNQLYDIVSKGFDQGEMTKLDVNKLDIEKARISGKLNGFNQTLNERMEALTALNGGDDCSNILSQLNSYPVATINSDDYYVTTIESNAPSLAYNRMSTAAASSMVKVVKRSWLPGFTVGYGYEYELGDRFNILSFGVTLPLFSNRHKTKAAQYNVMSSENEEKSILIDEIATMRATRKNAMILMDEIARYRPSFEREDNMQLLKKAFEGGQINLITLIQEMDYFLSARQEYMDMVYQYQILLAALNKYSMLE